jgi:hypothetical protein
MTTTHLGVAAMARAHPLGALVLACCCVATASLSAAPRAGAATEAPPRPTQSKPPAPTPATQQARTAAQATAPAPPTEKVPRRVGPDENIRRVTLVKSATGRAVVRFGKGPLLVIVPGDALGSAQAVVREIVTGQVVLDEPTTGPDGRRGLAFVVIRDGETGGTRYTTRSGTPPPRLVRPKVPDPAGQSSTSPKKKQ